MTRDLARRVAGSARRALMAVLAPGPAAMRGIAAAAVVANAVIMMTGAAVRLSKSGLGCPDWPRCFAGSLAATHVPGQTTLNTWIEFGNRLLTYPVVAVSLLAFVAAWQFRPPGSVRRRKDLVGLAAALPAGVVAQAVVGGIVVLTKLNPAWVAGHFVLSIAIVGAAVALHVRCQESAGAARPLVRPDLRILGFALVAATVVMIVAGTVVDGAGPLVGNAAAPRFHLSFVGTTQFHADIGWLMGGLAVALALGLTLSGAPRAAVRWSWATIALIAAQGAIGYAQFFGGMPAGLVWMHVCVAVLVWIAGLRLLFALRDRGVVGAEPDEAQVAGAAAAHP
jgi:cytochrome c oxidase assembly protein subunit 15